ncbi:flavin reductase family protein [Flavihumibacter fluvii]|uniref:flavin reductase family protein n=1 Tax=Flavihumibacter fluvii TaxID=2838157 RepID=UPI001BDECE3D|nr:flavin reductase family protein [Flavihumibacter fluvii]ULQ51439.1 flavin reductase family protein [Flavihumibacter fluvii]
MLINFSEIPPAMSQQWLQHAVAPRPICFASTISKKGEINLSPFSFFNLFSIVPPVLVFSPSRRMRDNNTKHTLDNVLEVPEVVINIVDYDMVQQTSLASCEYPESVNEFIKAGFTAEPATLIKPPMVKESKVKMECRVLEVKPLGNVGGSGNLVICEVLRMHINDSILNEQGTMIDQHKLHHVARLGSHWYCKVDSNSLFEVEKPNTQLGIGIDMLPGNIRTSKILSGNDLGQLANVQEIPMVDPAYDDDRLRNIFQYFGVDPQEMEKELHLYAKELLARKKIMEAWQVLLSLQ